MRLTGSNTVTVYHGGDKEFTTLLPKYMLMDSSVAHFGVGVYFTDELSVAETYGSKIMTTQVDKSNFLEAQSYVGDTLPNRKIHDLYVYLNKLNYEGTIGLLQDLGIEVYEKEDILPTHLSELVDFSQDYELRNFQIELSQRYGTENFVTAWNKVFKNIHGLVHSEFGFYIIINTKYKTTIL